MEHDCNLFVENLQSHINLLLEKEQNGAARVKIFSQILEFPAGGNCLKIMSSLQTAKKEQTKPI